MSNAVIESSAQTQASTVLVVEDDHTTSEIIGLVLKEHGLRPVPCFGAEEAIRILRENRQIGAALVDLSLPDGDGIDVLREARQIYPDLPCFVLTVKESVKTIVVTMKAGATDYLVKPFDPVQLITDLKAAMNVYCSNPDHRILNPNALSGIRHWQSPKMHQSTELALRAARSNSPILLTGEQNTGKKAIVRIIHESSGGAERPLVTLNASQLKPVQLEIELFGRPLSDPQPMLGAAKGKLEKCRGSNLYLENIEFLSPAVQDHLQAWITANEISEPDKPARCRLITSSTTTLEKAIHEGAFRQDLWYALSVYHVEIPNLSERHEDIPMLCENIITNICISKKLRRPTITRKALEMIMDHSWPGNLSELQSVLEHALTHTTDSLIGPNDLPRLLSSSGHKDFSRSEMKGIPLGSASIDDITKASLIAALEACGGNRRRAAQRLKVSLRTIYNMIQRYEIGSLRKTTSK